MTKSLEQTILEAEKYPLLMRVAAKAHLEGLTYREFASPAWWRKTKSYALVTDPTKSKLTCYIRDLEVAPTLLTEDLKKLALAL